MDNSIARFQISADEDFRIQFVFVGLPAPLAGRALRMLVKERSSNLVRTTLTLGSGLTLDGADAVTALVTQSTAAAWAKGEFETDLHDITGGANTRLVGARTIYDVPGRLPYGVIGAKATVQWVVNKAVVTAIGGIGPTGPANMLTIGDVNTLATGEPATATITGTAPEQTLNLGLPKGATGATGATGTLAVGTVMTGAPGSSVVITNVGTSTAAILDISIPRGDVGATGNKGWSPILAVVTDGARRVLQVNDWTGGQGTKPASGDYIGASGLTSVLANAVDIRGAQGPSGSVTDGDKGDIIVSGSGTAWEIDPGLLATLALKDLSNTDGPRGKYGGTLLAAGNYNTLTENGTWMAEPGATNAPEALNFYTVLVESTPGAVWITQYARAFGSDTDADSLLYKRDRTSGGTWSSWARVRETQTELDARYRSLSAPLGLNNRLINGDMRVSQRGSSFAANGMTLDRWQIQFGAGGAGSVTHSSFTGDDLSRLLFWQQTTGGTAPYLTQPVEDVRSLAGKRVCVSFSAALVSGTTTLTPRLFQNFGTGGSPSAGVTTTGIPITLTGGRVFQFLTLPSVVGKTLGSNNDHYLRLDLVAANGAIFSLNLYDVQLEEAPGEMLAPTPFERIPLALQVLMCQRYFAKLPTMLFLGYGPASPGGMYWSHSLPVTMRAVPSASLTTAPSVVGLTSYGVAALGPGNFYQTATATGPAGSVQVGGDGFITFNAELI